MITKTEQYRLLHNLQVDLMFWTAREDEVLIVDRMRTLDRAFLIPYNTQSTDTKGRYVRVVHTFNLSP